MDASHADTVHGDQSGGLFFYLFLLLFFAFISDFFVFLHFIEFFLHFFLFFCHLFCHFVPPPPSHAKWWWRGATVVATVRKVLASIPIGTITLFRNILKIKTYSPVVDPGGV